MTGDGHMRQLIYPMKEQYEEFLIDESKFSGYADSISFPESAEEMQEVLQELKKAGVVKMAASPCYEVLRQYDETHNGDLCYIFMQFLKNGRNINQTATAIFQHRNTVLNKVKKAVSIMQNECEDYQAHIAFILSYINDHENDL
mgnify:CR=1 FL=1